VKRKIMQIENSSLFSCVLNLDSAT